jgi:hypothetical protein
MAVFIQLSAIDSLLINFLISSMAGRKVFVNFISLKSPVQVKCVLLPESERRSDFIVLRELLFKAMMLDKSILVLGGSEASNVEDILILQYDEDFGDIIDVNHDVVFYHKQKDVVVKLRKNCIPNEKMSTITSFSFNGQYCISSYCFKFSGLLSCFLIKRYRRK